MTAPWSLPLAWDRTAVTLGNARFASDTHLPVLLYPNPQQAGRYVVLNGLPFSRIQGPVRDRPEVAVSPLIPATLGDFAILRVTPAAANNPAQSVYAGFFDELWQ